MSAAAMILGSFVVGSMPFSFWVVRRLRGTDLRTFGSGNPGATNALRVAGGGAAAIALALDVTKGAVPVFLALQLDADDVTIGAVAIAAVCGHCFSPWLSFHGGKGVATALGTFTILHPLAAMTGLAVFAVVVAWKRYVSLASVVASLAVLAAMAVGAAFGLPAASAGRPGALAVLVIVALVVARHSSNLVRLVSGRESRLGEEAR